MFLSLYCLNSCTEIVLHACSVGTSFEIIAFCIWIATLCSRIYPRIWMKKVEMVLRVCVCEYCELWHNLKIRLWIFPIYFREFWICSSRCSRMQSVRFFHVLGFHFQWKCIVYVYATSNIPWIWYANWKVNFRVSIINLMLFQQPT